MRKKRLTFVFLALFVSLSLMLGACSSREEPKPADSGTTPAPAPTPAPEPAPEPAKEKVVIYGRGADSVGLDPIQQTDGESFKVADEIFEQLLAFKPGTTEVEPGLATEWSPSADGLEWTFKLRQGVKFHDGTDFNADAVKYNFDRWRLTTHPEHKGGEFGYYPYQFGGFDGDSVIQDVQVVGPYEIKFVLKQPQGPFLQNIAMTAFGIASPTAVKADPDAHNTKPVGTGPFKFVRWDKGDKVELAANPDYWGEKAKIDRLIFRSIPDNNARLIALQSGELDMMDGIDPNFLKVIEGTGEFNIVMRPANNVGYLAFNFDEAPFNNPKVRQAINHAIDKQAIADAFYGGLGQPAYSPLPPAMWGKAQTSDVTMYDYNPDKAKALLADAGFKDGFKTQLWAMPIPRPYMPKPTDIAVAIQTNLRAVGIDAQIVTYDWGTYLDKTGVGEHTMALLGWTGDNGDPDNFLYVLLDKDNAKGPDAGNIAFYKSDPLHDVLIQAQKLTDQAQRSSLYVEAQKIITADAPWVPLVHSQVPVAVRKTITGFTPSPMTQEISDQLDITG